MQSKTNTLIRKTDSSTERHLLFGLLPSSNRRFINKVSPSCLMHCQFVSATLRPVAEAIDSTRMSSGEPGLPRQFRWGSRTVRIVGVLRTWRETGPCHHGSGERYVRKHWFEVVCDSGEVMKIYFERQARSRQIKSRWRLYTIARPDPAETA